MHRDIGIFATNKRRGILRVSSWGYCGKQLLGRGAWSLREASQGSPVYSAALW